ncbi:MFS transporter [Croceicoccus estronivorus]|uniref:MFS transporter n=1 Tax=Croceicoccus estronivorus TaxID=1172626 RepID=UPI000832A783|nr:MFS transporter [Croceicoccus estronivorus]OCC23514.1 MFS transporter [Croceicoccus estronivorus]
MQPQTGHKRPSIGTAYFMVGALFAIYVLAWLDRLIISMMVEPIKETLELGDFEMSLVLGPAFAISYAIFAIPLGWATDRMSRRLVIYIGVSIWSLATLACAFAQSFPMLIACRIGVGIGEAALLPAAYSLIADAFPRDRVTFATSLFQTAGKFGSAVAFGIGGILIGFATTFAHIDWPILGRAEGWQITFAMIGVPGFVFALLAYTFPEPGRHGVRSNAAGTSAVTLPEFLREHTGLLVMMAVAFTSLAVVGYSMTSWVPTYIDRHFHWEPQQYGPALSLMNVFGAISLVALGRAVDFLFARGMKDAHLRFYSWLILALSPAIVCAFFVSNVYLFLGLYALIQLITVPYIVYCSALVAMLASSELRGRLLGIFLLITNIVGFGAGPAIVGALTDFVFGDEALIGYSLATVVVTGSAIAFVTMRLALPRLRKSIEGMEAAQSA